MIAYIIKSGLCLALILLVYKVLLARERMYVFNRYYLLFGLCFAFVVPFITMETVLEIPFANDTTISTMQSVDLAALDVNGNENIQKTTGIPTWILAIMGLYAIGYVLFFFRFIRNIYNIFYKIIKSVRVRYKVASLVLLKENVSPHTFLHYIFLRKEAYDTQNIAEELYTHELAHVVQKHTLDIILIELIQIVFWFNPLLIYYKKAIQLNHEFLADDAVLKSNTHMPAYQQLLLANAHGNHNSYLASNLNFSVTKKRLQMMTKHTTRGRAWFLASLTIPIFITAIFLFSTKVIAQKTVTKDVATTTVNFQKTQNPKAEYYKNATFIFEDAQGNKTEKKYSELTAAEKARLIPPPPKPNANAPTSKQLNDWQDSSKFAIWLDGKVMDNKEIANHKIVHYVQSFVYKNARSKRFQQPYQTSLYTAAGFKALQNNHRTSLGKNAVLYFTEGSNQIRSKKKKVGFVHDHADAKEFAQTHKTSYSPDAAKGPNVTEAPYHKAPTQKPTTKHDIIVMIYKSGTFLVNYEHKTDLKNLDKYIKVELKKITHSKARTGVIIYSTAHKKLSSKVEAIMNANNINNIEMIERDAIPPPPPPPVLKKTQVKEIAPPLPPPPAPIDADSKKLTIMHQIMKGQKVETMMINGKKHYYVEKKGRKYIFTEDAKMVDEKGNELPPPPPKVKKNELKEKVEVREVKAKNKNKNKAKAKNKKETVAEKVKVIEVKPKSAKQKE